MRELMQKIRNAWGRGNGGKRHRPRIEYRDLWGLNATLAFVISCYLEEFIESIKLCGATPGDYVAKYGNKEAYGYWEKDLKRMLAAFRAYYRRSDGEQISKDEETGIQLGMELFFKRYSDLWF